MVPTFSCARSAPHGQLAGDVDRARVVAEVVRRVRRAVGDVAAGAARGDPVDPAAERVGRAGAAGRGQREPLQRRGVPAEFEVVAGDVGVAVADDDPERGRGSVVARGADAVQVDVRGGGAAAAPDPVEAVPDLQVAQRIGVQLIRHDQGPAAPAAEVAGGVGRVAAAGLEVGHGVGAAARLFDQIGDVLDARVRGDLRGSAAQRVEPVVGVGGQPLIRRGARRFERDLVRAGRIAGVGVRRDRIDLPVKPGGQHGRSGRDGQVRARGGVARRGRIAFDPVAVGGVVRGLPAGQQARCRS